MKKRLLSLLLCLVAVLTLLPLPALADGGHSHCICGREASITIAYRPHGRDLSAVERHLRHYLCQRSHLCLSERGLPPSAAI